MSTSHAIIPARSGSKRIPNKNIQCVNGVPLITTTIRNLVDAGIFESITVSTDSEQIQEIALRSGANCSNLRPAILSDDFTPTLRVVQHEIENSSFLQSSDVVLCVYPTSIMMSPSIFRSAVDTYLRLRSQLAFLISVSQFPHPIQRSMRLDSASKISWQQPQFLNTRTQDLTKSYFDAGQFYIGSKYLWLTANSLFESAYGFEISKYSYVDIDYPEDLEELRRRFRLP